MGHGRFHHVQNSQKAKSICQIMQLVNSSCVLYDIPDFSASSDKTLQHSSLYTFQSAQAQNLANPSPSSLASVAINIIHACELLTSITLSTFYLKCRGRREDMVLKKFTVEFSNKSWTLSGLKKLLRKIDMHGTIKWNRGSGRRRTVRTNENVLLCWAAGVKWRLAWNLPTVIVYRKYHVYCDDTTSLADQWLQ